MAKKSFIIDFDNTIGFFEQIIFLINIIETIYEESLNVIEICKLIDYYPYIFRPKIYNIIKLILYFQKKNEVSLFILYTCNKKPNFVEAIISYIEKKVDYSPLFNYILYEKSKLKNFDTILSNIQKENIHLHSLCFIDNKIYNYKQYNNNYIKCEKYVYSYEINEIINLFPYHIFKKINEKIIYKYFKLKKKKKKGLPIQMYELNSSFIIQSIRNFI